MENKKRLSRKIPAFRKPWIFMEWSLFSWIFSVYSNFLRVHHLIEQNFIHSITVVFPEFAPATVKIEEPDGGNPTNYPGYRNSWLFVR